MLAHQRPYIRPVLSQRQPVRHILLLSLWHRHAWIDEQLREVEDRIVKPRRIDRRNVRWHARVIEETGLFDVSIAPLVFASRHKLTQSYPAKYQGSAGGMGIAFEGGICCKFIATEGKTFCRSRRMSFAQYSDVRAAAGKRPPARQEKRWKASRAECSAVSLLVGERFDGFAFFVSNLAAKINVKHAEYKAIRLILARKAQLVRGSLQGKLTSVTSPPGCCGLGYDRAETINKLQTCVNSNGRGQKHDVERQSFHSADRTR